MWIHNIRTSRGVNFLKGFEMNFKFLSLFFLILSVNSFARTVDTLANCRLSNGESEEALSSFTVLRDGDRLYGRYRLNEGRDFEETDDIFMKKYEGEDLNRLKENGILKTLAETLKIEIEKIEKITFFGMVEIEDDEDEEGHDQAELTLQSPLISDNRLANLGDEDENPTPVPLPPKYLMEIYKVTGSLGVVLGSVGKPNDKPFEKCSSNRLLIFSN